MASSIMDLLLSEPSAQERFLQVMGLLGGVNAPYGTSSVSGVANATSGGSGSVEVLLPGDPRLVTRFGITLQAPAMQSLIDVARQSKLLPGIQELHQGQIYSYRTPAQQAALHDRKPGLAAPEGHSYHQSGLAIDWLWAYQHPEFRRLLYQAGWHQFDPVKEPWHFSYGVVG